MQVNNINVGPYQYWNHTFSSSLFTYFLFREVELLIVSLISSLKETNEKKVSQSEMTTQTSSINIQYVHPNDNISIYISHIHTAQ